MVIASFGCVGHARLRSWPSGCYCRYKGTEASVFYAGQSGFLRFRVAVHVPTLSRCPPAVHIGRCTHRAGSHSISFRLQLRSCACLVVLTHRPAHWGKVHTFKPWDAQTVVTAWILRLAILFFKSMSWACLKALFDCISSIAAKARIVNNQF